MPTLTLIVPGDIARHRSADLARRLARARHAPLAVGGWRAWVAREWGQAELGARPPAQLASGEAGAWFATPVHLVAGVDHVQMAGDGWLRLDANESERLAGDFAGVFAAPPLTITPIGAEGFLLRGVGALEAVTCDPARVLGGDIASWLPAGPAAAALRRLGSEIELWLHEHPANRERVARGEPPVSTLWLWGGGIATAAAAARPAGTLPSPAGTSRRGRPLVMADDEWLAALSRAVDAPFVPPATSIDALSARAGTGGDSADVVAVVRGPVAAEVEAHWIEPALRQLGAGRWRSVTFVLGDEAFRFRGFDLWKPWRRRAPRGEARP